MVNGQAVLWILAGVSTVLFAGRLLIRSILLKSFHLDDVFSALSWFFMMAAVVVATLETPLSYRFSAILIGEAPMPSSLDEVADLTVSLRRWNVAVQTLFWSSLYCVKFSFMFLYKTVLGSRHELNRAWAAALVYIILTYGICLIGVFGQCGPARNLFTYGWFRHFMSSYYYVYLVVFSFAANRSSTQNSARHPT